MKPSIVRTTSTERAPSGATCDHEIGKPGSWHRCKRVAVQRVFRVIGIVPGVLSLDYCERHKQ